MSSVKFYVKMPNGQLLTDKRGNKVAVETRTPAAIIHNIKKAMAVHSPETTSFITAFDFKSGKRRVTVNATVEMVSGKDGKEVRKVKYDESIDLEKIDGKEVAIHLRGEGKRAVTDGGQRPGADANDSIVGAIKQAVAASTRAGNSPSPVIVINAPGGGGGWTDVVNRRAQKSPAQAQAQPPPKPDAVHVGKASETALFEKFKDKVPDVGLHGKPSDLVLKQIISRNCLDEAAIERDVNKWWDGELELEPWENAKKPTQRGPKANSAANSQQTRPPAPKSSEAALAVTF